MKALIARQLYQPALVLPLLTLMQWMVVLDFSVSQVSLLVLAKSAQLTYRGMLRGYRGVTRNLFAPTRSRRRAPLRNGAPGDAPCRDVPRVCHCG
jgi:hypothetical protein